MHIIHTTTCRGKIESMTSIVNLYAVAFILIGHIHESNILEYAAAKYNFEMSDNNNFIRVGSDSLHNWTEAKTYCQNRFGLHLAAIHSLSENNDAFGDGEWYSKYGQIWIGLNDIDIEANYTWNDHSPFDYENWENKQDTVAENCVCMNTNDGQWNDISCSTGYYAFICRGFVYFFLF